MELIRISNQKIKIMLTPTDMTQYELNACDLGEESETAHLAFRHLLDEIGRQTDMEFDDKRISVRFFPSREGGCEMFVSCAQPLGGREARRETPLLPSAAEKPAVSGFIQDGAYQMETLDALLRACARLKGIGYIGESAAYRDESSRYYLLLRLLTPSPFSLPDELAFLCEYGKLENAAMLQLYFREHGSLICAPNAVDILAGLR